VRSEEKYVVNIIFDNLFLTIWQCFSFNINPEETFAEMNKKVEEYSHLIVTPPLQLKDFGIEAPRLVLLSHGNWSVTHYLHWYIIRSVRITDKSPLSITSPNTITVYGY